MLEVQSPGGGGGGGGAEAVAGAEVGLFTGAAAVDGDGAFGAAALACAVGVAEPGVASGLRLGSADGDVVAASDGDGEALSAVRGERAFGEPRSAAYPTAASSSTGTTMAIATCRLRGTPRRNELPPITGSVAKRSGPGNPRRVSHLDPRPSCGSPSLRPKMWCLTLTDARYRGRVVGGVQDVGGSLPDLGLHRQATGVKVLLAVLHSSLQQSRSWCLLSV